MPALRAPAPRCVAPIQERFYKPYYHDEENTRAAIRLCPFHHGNQHEISGLTVPSTETTVLHSDGPRHY